MRTPSPKLEAADIGDQRSWYRYYAGFSPRFVQAVLSSLETEYGRPIDLLDPWSGAGTAPSVAGRNGHFAVGLDINPAMIVVSRARHADQNDVDRAIEAVTTRPNSSRRTRVDYRDPLVSWFTEKNVRALRSLQREYENVNSLNGPSALNDEIPRDPGWCVLHLAFFRYVRDVLPTSCTRNPTWTKIISDPKDRIDHGLPSVRSGTLEHLRLIRAKLATESRICGSSVPPAYLRGNSTSLPYERDKFDAVITSPPYCTRVDYVRATYSELACMYRGESGWQSIRNLDQEMIGVTRLTGKEIPLAGDFHTPLVESVMDSIYNHPSKASSKYYWRYFALYFCSLKKSLEEIARVCRPSASVVFVVQGSFYKEVFIDLPMITKEYAELAGLHFCNSIAYDSRWDFGRINPKTQPNRSDSVKEVVLYFRKKA